jgi:drug/metabolite transporter (DMT)-like permease|tara:strand:+ start:90 stop:917 length:828 start_codon:yes stop_codon:yes gene_type:complete
MSLAMFSWAIAWTNAKIVGEYLSFYNLVFFRFLLGFLSLLPFIIIKKNPFPKMVDLKYILIPSLLFFVYNIAFFKGTHYGLAGTGGVLVTTLNPLCTILIMSLINKRIIKKEVVGMFLGVIGGIIIMNLHKEGMVNILNSNNIYFIICAITWGVMTVSVNYAQKRINPYIFICLCYLFTMIISFPFTNLGELNMSDLDFRFYINFFLVSIGAMSFGTSIYLYSTPILGPAKVSVFIFSVPFIAMGTAYLVLNEPFTINIVIGGLLSLLSIYIINK